MGESQRGAEAERLAHRQRSEHLVILIDQRDSTLERRVPVK